MAVLTNNLRKGIASLATSKGRRRSGLFMAEGTKCVLDTLDAFTARYIIATREWLEEHPAVAGHAGCDVIAAGRGDIKTMSSMTLAPDVIAVYGLPEQTMPATAELRGRLVLALDRVQDPGNMGTIMRTADWMGVDTILASDDCVDCFNPKAIQASMGAIARVSVFYGDLPGMLDAIGGDIAGTFLDGENVYTAVLPRRGIIVMGNEGQGIGEAVAARVTRRLLIPSYPPGRPTSESLNVATATAIVLSQYISRNYGKD
ncbi:MAG: RNA methyltransferase [Muribaculaceae bacterium]|nr:RNA methyltransferase [Muribaculaceae bacterium]